MVTTPDDGLAKGSAKSTALLPAGAAAAAGAFPSVARRRPVASIAIPSARADGGARFACLLDPLLRRLAFRPFGERQGIASRPPDLPATGGRGDFHLGRHALRQTLGHLLDTQGRPT